MLDTARCMDLIIPRRMRRVIVLALSVRQSARSPVYLEDSYVRSHIMELFRFLSSVSNYKKTWSS